MNGWVALLGCIGALLVMMGVVATLDEGLSLGILVGTAAGAAMVAGAMRLND